MANVTISDLTAATSVNGAELLEIEQSGVSKRVTAAEIAALGGGGGGGTGNDSNDNYSANNFLSAYRTQTTGGLTVTLTVASAYQQYFTGVSTATCKLPVTSTLTLGHRFFIANASTGSVTVQSSGLNTVATLSSGQSAMVTCILTSGASATSWSVVTAGTGGGGSGTGDALTSDPLSQFAATTSAQLKSVMTDETGSGALVFGTTPTIDQPVLTGSSGVADATTFWRGDKTWSTPPAGAGGGDALVANPLSQFAATTSAQLRGVISDETGTGAAVFASGPTLSAPALGTPVSGTLTSCTGLPVSTGVSGLGTGVATAAAVNGGSAGALGVLIASGTATLGTSAIASAGTATVVTVGATGVATTDVIQWTPNADISGVTGYGPVTSGGLIIYPYPTANNVNFKVGNPTAGSITPGAVTLNWKVYR